MPHVYYQKPLTDNEGFPLGLEAHQVRGYALGKRRSVSVWFSVVRSLELSGTTENPLSVASFEAERFYLVLFSACYSCFVIVSRFPALIYQILSLVRSLSFRWPVALSCVTEGTEQNVHRARPCDAE